MCKLPDAITNSEVGDLQERIQHYLDPALQYACKSWHKHLSNKNAINSSTIGPTIHYFLKEKFLFWLEVLSVLGAVREAVNALEITAQLLGVS